MVSTGLKLSLFIPLAMPCTVAGAQVLVKVTEKSYPPVQTYNPTATSLARFDNGAVSAQVVRPSSKLYLEVTRGKNVASTMLPDELCEVKKIAVAGNDEIVVSGLVNAAGSEVVIISSSGSILDKFACYAPAFSPDGRYVAFIHYYPPHFVDGPQSDRLMIYDLLRSAAQNRRKDVSVADWMDVGMPLLGTDPAAAAKTLGEVVSSASEIFWAPQGDVFAWFVRANGYRLLRVALGPAGKTDVEQLPVPQSVVCPSLASEKGGPCDLLLRSLSFGPENFPESAGIEVVPNHEALVKMSASSFVPIK